MSNHICPKITVIILLCCGQPSYSCIARNYSCNDMKNAKGFKYKLDCPSESEVAISSDGTVLVHALRDQRIPDLSEEVTSFSRTSMTLGSCLNITILCAFTSKEGNEEETCADIKVFPETPEETTERPKSTTDGKKKESNTTYKYWIAGVFLVLVAMIAVRFFCWKRNLRNQYGPATLGGVRPYLFDCSSFTGVNCRRELQEDPAGDESNSETRNGRCGSGGNNAEQDLLLQSVSDPRIDHKSDGRTAQPLSLGGGSPVPTETDNITGQTTNTISSHRAVNGRANNGWTAAEDHDNERRSLLCAHGATIQTSDMTGEAAASMNESGFNSESHSGCSAELKLDVESTNDSEDLQEIKVYQ